jgi:hypothetical protein
MNGLVAFQSEVASSDRNSVRAIRLDINDRTQRQPRYLELTDEETTLSKFDV